MNISQSPSISESDAYFETIWNYWFIFMLMFWEKNYRYGKKLKLTYKDIKKRIRDEIQVWS